ncbi:MAG: TonB-dependent receptor [Bryobacteraceae bacterium]|nr:TonB-dependent receptor [Bryobacteraceae bacterium]
MRRVLLPALIGALLSAHSFGQTTQGLISGRALDSRTGRALQGASVACWNSGTGAMAAARSDADGFFVLPLLSPGLYRVRVVTESYQPQELYDLELPVAGRVDINFRLRPLNDVWEAGQYRSVFLPGSKTIVTFYGPDVDSSRSASFEGARPNRGILESSVSQVVDPVQIEELPLAGRDVYTMLVTQAGVTADTTTARSLGLSSNGQRPSASNFLLDGLENNNYLVTGPLTSMAPEAIQEYRVSTNNFSAEYGRTSGYLSNAVTRSGSNRWHGTGYFNLKNDALNANDFQSNLRGVSRSPAKEAQTGLWAGGPIRRETLFVSGAHDYLRSRGRGAEGNFPLPTANLLPLTSAGSVARELLTRYPAPVAEGPGLSGLVRLSPPVTVDRHLSLLRADQLLAGGAHRLMGRIAMARLSRPDFVWTPYEDFASGLDQDTNSFAFSLLTSPRPNLTNEAKVGRSWDKLNLDRPHSQIPILSSFDGTILPGSPVFSVLRHRSRNWELLDNVIWARGRHVAKFGGGILLRNLNGVLTAGADGQYGFENPSAFARDVPLVFRISLDRGSLPTFRLPDFGREYRSTQFFLFAQDTYKVSSRLALNYGVRYESYGAPTNVGQVKDAVVELGEGQTMAERVAAASVVYPSSGNQRVYSADRNDWAGRFGFSYSLNESGGSLLRGGFGTYYDRPYDNLWMNARNNNFVLPTSFLVNTEFDYLTPVADVLPLAQGQPVVYLFPEMSFKQQSARAPLTLFQPDLRSAYVHSYFFGLSQQLGDAWSLELNTLGSLGRKLITTDIVNRGLNPELGPISYRANQGTSNYNALTSVVRHRSRYGQLQAAYTWSHTIDNQSEVLRSDYFDLNPTRLTVAETRADVSAFSLQFDSAVDRANSDFDQRHNFIVLSIWEVPAWRGAGRASPLFRGWRVSQLAAFRSGMPYTVYALDPPDRSPVINNRANLVDLPALEAAGGQEVAGGRQLLPAQAFARPPLGQLGNTGRNAFRGPGFYNVDLSLSRAFALPWLGETGRLTFRADAFNFLNHANLNLPNSRFGTATFGIARYGRRAGDSGLPILSPVNDTSRQIQMIVRLDF